jgi:hypothetical protein
LAAETQNTKHAVAKAKGEVEYLIGKMNKESGEQNKNTEEHENGSQRNLTSSADCTSNKSANLPRVDMSELDIGDKTACCLILSLLMTNYIALSKEIQGQGQYNYPGANERLLEMINTTTGAVYTEGFVNNADILTCPDTDTTKKASGAVADVCAPENILILPQFKVELTDVPGKYAAWKDYVPWVMSTPTVYGYNYHYYSDDACATPHPSDVISAMTPNYVDTYFNIDQCIYHRNEIDNSIIQATASVNAPYTITRPSLKSMKLGDVSKFSYDADKNEVWVLQMSGPNVTCASIDEVNFSSDEFMTSSSSLKKYGPYNPEQIQADGHIYPGPYNPEINTCKAVRGTGTNERLYKYYSDSNDCDNYELRPVPLTYSQQFWRQPPTCKENHFVSNNECKKCAPGSTRAAGDLVDDKDTECATIVCEENYYVFNNECKKCAPGTINAAGDSADDKNTECATIVCEENHYVSNNECKKCAPGSTRAAGDLADDKNTECATTVCKENHYVFNNECKKCAPGTIRAAGDPADDKNTECATTVCEENHYVFNNECKKCATGRTRLAGDKADGPNTECERNSTSGAGIPPAIGKYTGAVSLLLIMAFSLA